MTAVVRWSVAAMGLLASTMQARPEAEAVVVAADGSGTFRTVTEGVTAAGAGGKVSVRPGTYRESLRIVGAIEIAGAGTPTSIIIEADTGPPVSVGSSGKVVLLGLTIRSVSKDKDRGTAVEVSGGTLTLEDCVLESKSGVGLRAGGEQARVTLRGCTLTDCAEYGAFLDRGAVLSASRTTFSCGEWCAVNARGKSSVELVDCRLVDAEKYGILAEGEASVTATKCEVGGAGIVGVFATEKGKATLKDCTVAKSRACGMQAADEGVITMEGGKVTGCASNGVEAKTGGRVILQGVEIGGNMGAGVLLYEKGSADLLKCEVKGNGEGIEAREESTFSLKECRFLDAKEMGIAVHLGATGPIEKCTVSGNAGTGIFIFEDGAPVVRACKVEKNAGFGIRSGEGGRGSVEGCDLRGNRKGPWYADTGSRTTFAKNREK